MAAEPMDEKSGRNARVQRRYDDLMLEGKHGHYETMFRVVREEVERLARERDGLKEQIEVRNQIAQAREEGFTRCRAERDELQAFADWVETWVSNPVGSYSVHALDGLFAMTRDKLAALRTPDTSP